MKKVFLTEEGFKAVLSGDKTGLSPFKFPCPVDVEKAPHVLDEYMTTQYQIIHTDPQVVREVADKIFGNDNRKELLLQQLEINREHVTARIEESPEYQAHAKKNGPALEASMTQVHGTMQSRADEYVNKIEQREKQRAEAGKNPHELVNAVSKEQPAAAKVIGQLSLDIEKSPQVSPLNSPRKVDSPRTPGGESPTQSGRE